MRKSLLTIICLLSIQLLFSQVYKSGTISSSETWSGTVYLDGNVTITATVTINAGTRVLFKGDSEIKLIVDGAGLIDANGSSGNEIYFSADDDEDGTYGETGERGLKIQLYPTGGSTGNSSFDYCIFEYIDCANETGNNAYGAFDISNRPVTFNYCTFRNNKAEYGGAFFLRSSSTITLNNSTVEYNSAESWGGGLYFGGASGTINNCIIRNNTAVSGGGIFVYTGGPTIQNCLVYSNSVTGSGAGITLNNANSSMKLVNTTCAKNIVSGSIKDLAFSGTSGQLPKIINSIIWGSDIGSLDASLITISNSAIQGFSNVSSHTASISLSSNNTGDANSPYFSDPGNYNWTIGFSSACRDIGVNSYTGVSIPSTDYNGKSRIGTKDIGAYEVQYSLWTGATSTSWATATNWDQSVDPGTGTGDVVIPVVATNYPVNAANPNFTIGSGKQMIVSPGAKVTLDGLTNSGSLLLKSDASGIASMILNSFSGNNANAELYLTGGAAPVEGNRWHLISSPFMTLSRNAIWAVTNNLAQWVESYDRGDLTEGWIAADGYDYSLGYIPGSPTTFTNLNLGQGYTHYYTSNYTYTISGELNTETKNVNIYCSDVDRPLLYGHNLIGNPFSSGFDWDQVVDDLNYPANTSKVLHYRKDGGHVYYINDVGSEPGVNGIIPPMQGFFVKTYAASGEIILDANYRTHDNIPTRYKGEGKTQIPLIRLKINYGELYDYATVRFDESAKSGLDYDFDAVKDFLSTKRPSLYTISEGTKFTINGLPFPEDYIDIPVAIKIINAGTHTINTPELTGLDNYNIYLIDNQTGYTANLKTDPLVTFTSGTGLITDRFILKVGNIATGTEEPLAKPGIFNIYNGLGSVNIQTLSGDWDGQSGSVRILDLTGRTLADLNNAEFNRSSLLQLQEPATRGLYVVEIRSGLRRHVQKIVVK